ncbi:tRNA-splicing endonuclease subunit Sen15 [Megalops cyprinoides]|uniref:tRNA-splicing endonuclease subunit Sen15 n=1 Tax=Megalops cyprinoides TaxID=118141 RepID=UPI0018650E91|nr:tRNA-splicing endonuclease subunit Sen15 [Megalops cyprinoides]
MESTDMEESEAIDGTERIFKKPLSANWMLHHPKYQELMGLGVGQTDKAQVYAAFLVYLDLTEVRQWYEVSSRESCELHLVLLEGREREGEPPQVILPLPAHRTLSHKWVRSILCRVSSEGPPTTMLLCAVASDSSLVYQRLCAGLLTPEPPVGIEDQGRRQHRKRRLH